MSDWDAGAAGFEAELFGQKRCGKYLKGAERENRRMGEERVGLVVGDEAPYQVLARLGCENTITTAVQVPIVRKQEVETYAKSKSVLIQYSRQAKAGRRKQKRL